MERNLFWLVSCKIFILQRINGQKLRRMTFQLVFIHFLRKKIFVSLIRHIPWVRVTRGKLSGKENTTSV